MVAKNNSVARVRGPRSAARRQHILAATRDLFVKRGFHQTGMAQIASSSGIAVGQIYRDFANKEAIIAAICEADLAEWLEEETLETAVAVGDREGILAWIERIAIDEPSHENRRMMCEFVATVGCNPIIAEINRKADVRLRTSLGAALASLAPGASPQDRSTVVDFIITMSWGMVAGAELFPYRDHKILRHYMASLFRRELAAMCN